LKLTQTFYFEAAHTLSNRKVGCYDSLQSQNIHGHTYHVHLSINGELNKDGMVMDFDLIKYDVNYLKSLLDHQFLNEIEDLGLPTMENICLYIKNKTKIQNLCEIVVERKASGDRVTLKI
jgi:6-pyruvoyltetrahydropterin/6-carboxytetrahydropterin synthase